MRALAACLATAAAAALAACGGDDALTKEELVARADAVCRDVDRQVRELPEPKNLPDLADQVERVEKITDENLPRLKELEPPEEQKANYDRFIKSIEERDAKLGQIKELARRSDERGIVRQGAEIARITQRTNRTAMSVGLKDCGAGLGTSR